MDERAGGACRDGEGDVKAGDTLAGLDVARSDGAGKASMRRGTGRRRTVSQVIKERELSPTAADEERDLTKRANSLRTTPHRRLPTSHRKLLSPARRAPRSGRARWAIPLRTIKPWRINPPTLKRRGWGRRAGGGRGPARGAVNVIGGGVEVADGDGGGAGLGLGKSGE